MLEQLPQWKCHKVVRAAKIVTIDCGGAVSATNEKLDVLVLDGGMRISVEPGWLERHDVRVGGYFVAYDDGYTSYSPAEAFEAGYTRL